MIEYGIYPIYSNSNYVIVSANKIMKGDIILIYKGFKRVKMTHTNKEIKNEELKTLFKSIKIIGLKNKFLDLKLFCRNKFKISSSYDFRSKEKTEKGSGSSENKQSPKNSLPWYFVAENDFCAFKITLTDKIVFKLDRINKYKPDLVSTKKIEEFFNLLLQGHDSFNYQLSCLTQNGIEDLLSLISTKKSEIKNIN